MPDLAERGGLAPQTRQLAGPICFRGSPGSLARFTLQLSWQDLHPRHPPYQEGALLAELQDRLPRMDSHHGHPVPETGVLLLNYTAKWRS